MYVKGREREREKKRESICIWSVGDSRAYFVSIILQHFYMDINRETMELVHLILQTLIETCVGNFPNQEVIYNRQIVDVLNVILQLNIGDHKKYGYELEDVSGPVSTCGLYIICALFSVVC